MFSAKLRVLEKCKRPNNGRAVSRERGRERDKKRRKGKSEKVASLDEDAKPCQKEQVLAPDWQSHGSEGQVASHSYGIWLSSLPFPSVNRLKDLSNILYVHRSFSHSTHSNAGKNPIGHTWNVVAQANEEQGRMTIKSTHTTQHILVNYHWVLYNKYYFPHYTLKSILNKQSGSACSFARLLLLLLFVFKCRDAWAPSTWG